MGSTQGLLGFVGGNEPLGRDQKMYVVCMHELVRRLHPASNHFAVCGLRSAVCGLRSAVCSNLLRTEQVGRFQCVHSNGLP